jgi:phosphatidylinositol alpha-1,6-mannosyltransferase
VPSPIVLLTPNLTGHDGISAVARLVARAFDRVSVLALHERPSLTAFEGVTVHGAGGRPARFAAAAVRAAARGARPTVIVNHVHLAPAALVFAARGATLVSILHGIEAWKPLSWLQRAALTRSDRLIAVSAFCRDRFCAENPLLCSRPIDVCHHGIGPASVADTASDDTPMALIVGRMTADERYKGHDALIEIWPAVMAAVPDAVLRIVGDGDDRSRLEQKAVSMGLGAHVVFVGGVDDESLQREYQRATVFTMPSPREGFGLVFLEAMRAGRSCIGCRGAASEIINDGETGWIVEPGNRAQLTDTIVRTLCDRSESAAMGARGRARYLQYFTEEHFRQRLTALVPVPAAIPA